MTSTTASESFISRAREKHSGRYGYDLVEYRSSKEKVVIACKEHGNFMVTPNNHLRGTGCAACKQAAMSKLFRKDSRTFLKEAEQVHGDKYDYAKTVYASSYLPVTITCPVHGGFQQMPNHHLGGSGCATCGLLTCATARSTGTEGFIGKARAIHGDTYEYPEVAYINSGTKVSINCKKHGSFTMTPGAHLSGQGCNKCGHGSLSKEDFISKAQQVHGEKYNYSDISYNGTHHHVNILCREHGHFKQIPYVHLRGSGCASCGLNGFDYNKPGTLYVMTCGDITKVGITNKTTLSRAKRISGSFGSEFTVVKEFSFEDGQECSDIETKLLRILRLKYKSPTAKFDGYSESFMSVDRQWLNMEIDQLIGVLKDIKN